MRAFRFTPLAVAAAALLLGASASRSQAQGITTGAVTGYVTGENGAALAGVAIRVRNPKTGFTAGVLSREDGRYFIQGLETGV